MKDNDNWILKVEGRFKERIKGEKVATYIYLEYAN